MSSAIPPATVDSSTDSIRSKPKRRHPLAGFLYSVFGRTGAMLGGIWVVFLVIVAVFAPLIATSHPWYMVSRDGEVSFPVLQHLTWVDVTLLVAFILVVPLIFVARRVGAKLCMLVFFIAVMVCGVASYMFVEPPRLVVLSQYREMQKDGEVETMWLAPVPYSPTDRMREVMGKTEPLAPSWQHLLGTTRDNADMASRIIHATRIALSIGIVATGIALFIGIIVGSVLGYFAGWVDLIGLRFVEIFSSIPSFFLVLTAVAAFGRNLIYIMIILGVFGWVGYAMFIRAEFFKLRKQDFVQAAIATGTPLHSILFRHMLPNGVSPVLVEASFGIAAAILAEAYLSFLGLGPIDMPSWGQLLSQAVSNTGGFYWWIATFPGLMIFLTVFSYNLIGEAMRDVFDPRTAATKT